MKNGLFGFIVMVFVACTPFDDSFAATLVFDLGQDWSDTNNPNGPWSYNDGDGPITSHVSSWIPPEVGQNPQPAWAQTADQVPGHIVSWFKSTNDVFDWAVGDVITHTWDSSNGARAPLSNVIFTSPVTGTLGITGSVWLARNIGRAVNWSISANSVVLTGGSLFDGDPFDRTNPFNLAAGSGGVGVLSQIPVSIGDKIMLSFDTASTLGEFTGVNLRIELTPVPIPGGLWLFGSGLAALVTWARPRHRKSVQ